MILVSGHYWRNMDMNAYWLGYTNRIFSLFDVREYLVFETDYEMCDVI